MAAQPSGAGRRVPVRRPRVRRPTAIEPDQGEGVGYVVQALSGLSDPRDIYRLSRVQNQGARGPQNQADTPPGEGPRIGVIAHQNRHRSLASLDQYIRMASAWTDNAAITLGVGGHRNLPAGGQTLPTSWPPRHAGCWRGDTTAVPVLPSTGTFGLPSWRWGRVVRGCPANWARSPVRRSTPPAPLGASSGDRSGSLTTVTSSDRMKPSVKAEAP